MDGYSIKLILEKEGMLKKGISLLAWFILLFGCREFSNDKFNYQVISKKILGNNQYNSVYKSAFDTIKKRVLLTGSYYFLENGRWFIDSLLVCNKSGDRCVTNIMSLCEKDSGCVSEDLHFLYAEKINNAWFFFHGPTLIVPRDMFKNHDSTKPLSYQQLHQIALKEIYSGYLLPNGEINEAWFTQHFEGPGWYKWDETPEQVKKLTRKDFEQRHLDYVRRMWEGRDTTKPAIKNEKL